MSVRALVITAPGINCDLELAHAFTEAGALVDTLPLLRLVRHPGLIEGFKLIGLPGGFSYGDDIAAGRVLATLMRKHLYGALKSAIQRGCPIIAPCNGFQVAVQAGLLPGPQPGLDWPEEPARPNVSLSINAQATFRDCWTPMEVPENSRCIWTREIDFDGALGMLPSAHGEGRFVSSDPMLNQLEESGQVALRYAEEANFNGSSRRIAGICDPSGLVLGLMPHPERFTRWSQHPAWTRLDPRIRAERVPPGLAMFQNAVAHATTVSV